LPLDPVCKFGQMWNRKITPPGGLNTIWMSDGRQYTPPNR
jgi:hypothetical protein